MVWVMILAVKNLKSRHHVPVVRVLDNDVTNKEDHDGHTCRLTDGDMKNV